MEKSKDLDIVSAYVQDQNRLVSVEENYETPQSTDNYELVDNSAA